MKSVGEAHGHRANLGKEALQKALRSLEIGAHGLSGGRWGGPRNSASREEIERKLITPCAERIFYIRHAFRAGFKVDAVYLLTKIDRWFLQNIKEIVDGGGRGIAKAVQLGGAGVSCLSRPDRGIQMRPDQAPRRKMASRYSHPCPPAAPPSPVA